MSETAAPKAKKILIVVGSLLAIVPLLFLAWFFTLGPTVKGPMWDFLRGNQVPTPDGTTLKNRFKLPGGLRLGVFAEGVRNARMMAVTATGDILVTSHRRGDLILLHADRDGDGRSDGRDTLLSDRQVPHGIALHDGMLYLAEEHQIVRGAYDAERRTLGALEVIFTGLPTGGNHRTRTIKIGPDRKLYVTIGSSCNVCEETQPYRAEMLQMNLDGSEARAFATGLRNAVGFDFQPGTGALFATDNGRDLLGDEIPHCELNKVVEGGDYGWPYAFENRVADPDFGPGNEDKVKASLPMLHGFGGHRAPLGLTFIRQDLALVALHGSWNRSTLAGYKVVALKIGSDGSVEQSDFLTGFEQDENVIGRPVDIAVGREGALYVSDDYAGVIYRIGNADIPVAGYEDIAGDPETALVPASPQTASRLPDPVAAALAGLKTPKLQTTASAEVSLGALVFIANDCATCHIPGAAEGVAVKPLRKLRYRYDKDDLIALMRTPPSPMPTYDLSDEERSALAAYLLATAGE